MIIKNPILDMTAIKHQEDLIRIGPRLTLYKSSNHSNIILTINDLDGKINSIRAECCCTDIDSTIIMPWFEEVNGDLDELIKIIAIKYGENQ